MFVKTWATGQLLRAVDQATPVLQQARRRVRTFMPRPVPAVASPRRPAPTAQQQRCDVVCRAILGDVHRHSLRPPADVAQWLLGQAACEAADKEHGDEVARKAGRDMRHMAKQAAPVVAVAAIARALAVPNLASLGVLAGALWGSMRYNLTPLLGRYPQTPQREAFDEAALAQKEDLAWAHEKLRATLQLARDRLEPLPTPPRIYLPPAGSLVAAPAARTAVDGLAKMLDAYRQRHHYVAAAVESLAGEAAHVAQTARATLTAAHAGAGARALKFCGVALALSFAVGLLHPFASFVGFFLSSACLVGAGLLLVTHVRQAMRYLDGTLTEPAGGPADVARKHRALAALAQQQGRQVDQAWPLQRESELALAPLYAQLDKLEAPAA